MKLLVFLGVAAAAVLLLSPLSDRGPGEGSGAARTSSVTVGTFNIHYISSSQSSMRWESRRDAVVRALRDGNADVVAFQEMETFEGGHWSGENRQLDWVRGRFPEYAVAAVGNPMSFPSTQPILFRRERFDRLDQGFFSFSPTPDVPYARPWKRSFPSFWGTSTLRGTSMPSAF